jgi:SAM-dependent methyltransferase
VRLLTRILPWQPGWRVLDVACGAGRHAAALAAAGAHPVGIDLSPALLRRARGAGVPLVRGDMRRLPFRRASVDLAVNLFTSFGYFERDDEHAGVLRGIAATIKPGGWFVMDFLNADTVRATLVPEETQVLGGGPAQVTRELIDGERFVRKTIQTADGRRFVERVRLFTPGDLEAMMGAAGLDVQGRYGDYDGGPLRSGAPRALLAARRAR